MGLYQKFVLPRLIDVAMRNKEVAVRRAELIPKASGAVLEIGIGSGLNLPFFPGTISRLAGVDPSAELLSMARPKLGGVSFPVELFCRSAEDLPFDDRSFDTAVLTWTLCSILHPQRELPWPRFCQTSSKLLPYLLSALRKRKNSEMQSKFFWVWAAY